MNKEQKHITIQEEPEYNSALEAFAVKATHHIGSTTSLMLHSAFFVGIFSLQWLGFSFDKIMLLLTTVVSLEAIYLSIFIQLTINRQSRQIKEVSEDVEEIHEDVEEISKDIDIIEENVEGLNEELEKDDVIDAAERTQDLEKINKIENVLEELLREVKTLKKS